MLRYDIPSIDGLSRDQVVTLLNCRTLMQYISMIEDYKARKCPFCDPLDPVKNRILKENALWRMWQNPFPLNGTRAHLILAPKRHIGPDNDVTLLDFMAMGELFIWAQNELNVRSGGLLTRFGRPDLNAGTVLHLHTNIIVPDETDEVRLPLMKTAEKFNETVVRMQAFERLRCGDRIDDLTTEQQRLVEGRIDHNKADLT